MPPKAPNESKVPKQGSRQAADNVEDKRDDTEIVGRTSSGTKRKQNPTNASSNSPTKAPRRSARSTPKAAPSQLQLLNFLLSPDSLPFCQPPDEAEALGKNGSLRTYSAGAAHFSPFEELLAGLILSRPISHRLGVRTIRTILNGPYEFTTPKSIRDAGGEKIHAALWDSRTQHKNKTANEIDLIADVILDKFTTDDDKDGSQLAAVAEKAGSDVQKQSDLLKSSIKGLGKTGLDIFFRRIQWLWPACYPFIDKRTQKALTDLSLPEDGNDLDQLIKNRMDSLEIGDLSKRSDEEKRRSVFVIVLERAIGAHLEGKSDELLRQAAES